MTFSVLAPAISVSEPVLGSTRRARSSENIGSLEHATLEQPLEFSLAEYNNDSDLRASVSSELQKMQEYKQNKGLLWIKVTTTEPDGSDFSMTGVYNGHNFIPSSDRSSACFNLFLTNMLRPLTISDQQKIRIESYTPASQEISFQNSITHGCRDIARVIALYGANGE